MKVQKIVAICLLAASGFLAGCRSSENLEIALVDPDAQIKAGDTVSIRTNLSGFNSRIDPNDITVSRGSESWVENGEIKFKSNTPGTYNLSVLRDGVQSNVLSIQVLDRNGHAVDSPNPSGIEEDLFDQIADGDKVSVAQAIENKDTIISKKVSIVMEGYLPLTGELDEYGVETPVLYDENHANYILLKGFDVPFGECTAEATGTLYENSKGQLVMQMTYLYSPQTPVYKDKDKNKDSDSDQSSDSEFTENEKTES
ncbi:MAG: hypothetical protein ACI32F_03015 [Allobaculum sp.]